LSIKVNGNGCFERFVIFRNFSRTDHRFGGRAVADGIAAGALFAFFRNWTGAFARVTTVGLVMNNYESPAYLTSIRWPLGPVATMYPAL
jgi:hypothetical protein